LAKQKGVKDMNTPELQRLKMEWLAARESGDAEAQRKLLLDHPGEQAALVDFMAGYYATETVALEENATLLPLTQRAAQKALERVFVAPALAANLAELRRNRHLSKVDVAKGLRLTVDVWNKFESGAIELVSLSTRQLDRLAAYFQVNVEQFSTLLNSSRPSVSFNRRQTREAARSEQQSLQKQSFTDAIARSTMSQEDQRFWLDA
jgi:transcriptional regulator with XRE-family HTH domain